MKLNTLILFGFFLLLSGYSFAKNGFDKSSSPNFKTSFEGFIENKGQMADVKGNLLNEIYFKADLNGIDMFVTSTGLTYVFKRLVKTTNSAKLHSQNSMIKDQDFEMEWNRVDVELKDASIKKCNVVASKPYSHILNYYLPQCSSGIRDVKTYQSVLIKNVYPGIDWRLYTNDGEGIKYDFIVHPGADLRNIRMKYSGNITLEESTASNKLNISTSLGEIQEGSLLCYQKENNNNYFVKANYKLESDEVIFTIPHYDGHKNLFIDPPVKPVWVSYFGGSSHDNNMSAAIDNLGNLYTLGYTYSGDYLTQPMGTGYFQGIRAGQADIVISKFDNSGVLQWSTYYGGSNTDFGYDLVTDCDRNVFIVGNTASSDFPVQFLPGAYNKDTVDFTYSLFITKFDNAGVLNWSTYYGGRSQETPSAITADANGNIFVTGSVWSSDFPTLDPGNGAYYDNTLGGSFSASSDVFILKFNNNGVREWATFYGGENGPGEYEISTCITADNNGNVYVGGYTKTPDFPVLYATGAYNQTKLNNPGYEEGFLLKFNNDGVRKWATFFGSISDDRITAITTDLPGNLYVTGFSGTSMNFPFKILTGAYNQTNAQGGKDIFISKFDINNDLVWSTAYGGYGFASDTEAGNDIAVDNNGNIFVTGQTSANDFPTQFATGAYNQTYAGWGGFVGDAVIIQFNSSCAREWATCYGGSDDDGGKSVVTDPSGCVFVAGSIQSNSVYTKNPYGGVVYNSALTGGVSDPVDNFIFKACPQSSSLSAMAVQASSCCGDSAGGIGSAAVAFPKGGVSPYTYSWSNSLNTQSVTGLISGLTYSVTITDSTGAKATAIVTIAPAFSISVSPSNPASVCIGSSVNLNANGGISYTWSPSTSLNTTLASAVTASPTADITYIITGTASNGCKAAISLLVEVKDCSSNISIPNIFTPNGDGKNETFVINARGVDKIKITIYNRWGEKVYESDSVKGGWDGNSTSGNPLPDGVYYYLAQGKFITGNDLNEYGHLTLVR